MTLLPIAYFPSIHYLKVYFSYPNSVLEIHENFIKQSIRNRCEILTGNGILRLSIPLIHSKGIKIKTKEILIDYENNWQLNHWRAIKSAYAASPYFEDYEYDIRKLIFTKDIFLIDKNKRILEFLFSLLELDKTILYSTKFNDNIDLDFRKTDFLNHTYDVKNYQQVFSYKNNFISNLSILDLLMNEGPFIRNWILSNRN
jgi:hypothetical protein